MPMPQVQDPKPQFFFFFSQASALVVSDSIGSVPCNMLGMSPSCICMFQTMLDVGSSVATYFLVAS